MTSSARTPLSARSRTRWPRTGGRVAHAYLFTGIRGTGKTSTARILAKAVNCLNPVDGEPCNECAILRRDHRRLRPPT